MTFTCSAGGNGGTFAIDSSSVRWLVTDQFPSGTCETDVAPTRGTTAGSLLAPNVVFVAVINRVHSSIPRTTNLSGIASRWLFAHYRHLRISLIRSKWIEEKKKENINKSPKTSRRECPAESRRDVLREFDEPKFPDGRRPVISSNPLTSLSSLIASFCFFYF